MEQALEYADDTVTSSLFLTMEVLQALQNNNDNRQELEDAIDDCLSHAGVGIGLTILLRATPVRLVVHGECPLPEVLFPPSFPFNDLVMEARNHNDSSDDADKEAASVLSESDAGIVDEAVRHVAQEALAHLQQARALQGSVPKHLRLCLLPVIPSTVYLERLEAANYNIFDPQVIHDPTRLRLLLLLGRTWLTNVL